MEQTRALAGPELTPRTAVVWTVLRAELDRHGGRPLTVLDIGGGTGGFAVPLAAAGHRVTVVDASPDALAALTRRAAEAAVGDRIRAVQGDGDALAGLVEPGSVDLVLCHAVLEVVDDPATVLAAIATALRPGGAASVLVAGRAAAVLTRAMNGHLSTAASLAAATRGEHRRPGHAAPPLRRRHRRHAADRGRPDGGGDPRRTGARRSGAGGGRRR